MSLGLLILVRTFLNWSITVEIEGCWPWQVAKAGKPAYFWALLSTPEYRNEMAKEGWRSVGKVFIVAIILDVVYQLKVHSAVYAGKLRRLKPWSK